MTPSCNGSSTRSGPYPVGALLLSLAFLVALPALPQGTVLFRNTLAEANAPVYDLAVGGQKLDGPTFAVQLYAGPDGTPEDQLLSVGPVAAFRTGAGAGYFTTADAVRTIPGVPPGSRATLQVRAWTLASGETFESAVLRAQATQSAADRFGRSPVFSVVTGGELVPPATLAGLQSFAIAPWPGWPSGPSTNLVVNGGFDGAQITGWSQPSNLGGFVGAPGSAQGGIGDWIVFEGSLYQDLNTTPGQSYLLSFATSGYALLPQPPDARLQVHWSDQLMADHLMPSQTQGWQHPQFIVTAYQSVTRIRFKGRGLPPLDDVAVIPLPPEQPTIFIQQPTTNATFVERGSLTLTANPTVALGRSIVRVDFYRDGAHLLGSRTNAPYEIQWTNLVAGSPMLSARVTDDHGSATTSTGVRILVTPHPTVRIQTPRDRQVIAAGDSATIKVSVSGNEGALKQLDLFANGDLLQSFVVAPPEANLVFSWSHIPLGNYTLTAIGRDAAGQGLDTNAILFHAMEPSAPDVAFWDGTASVRLATNVVMAQTFRPTVNGFLHHIDVPLSPGAYFEVYPAAMEILPTTEGRPAAGATPVASTLLTAADIGAGGPFSFFFPSNRVALHTDRTYAFVLSSASPFYGLHAGANHMNGYPDGALWQLESNGTWQPFVYFDTPNPDLDLLFATHVEPDKPPAAQILTPTNGASAIGGTWSMTAQASDPDDTVERVDYYVDDQPAGSATTPPYSIPGPSLPAGPHTIQAVAFDSFGVGASSARVTMLIRSAPLDVHPVSALDLRQTGLFRQTIITSNSTAATFDAVRLWVQLDDASLAQGVRLWNASGSSNGIPYVFMGRPLQPGASLSLELEYFVPNRSTLPAPSFFAEAVPSGEAPAPAGQSLVLERVLPRQDGSVLLEFLSQTNRTYSVQYSPDAASWKTALPPLAGTGTRLQWIDLGPPKTESWPTNDPVRFYRLILWP